VIPVKCAIKTVKLAIKPNSKEELIKEREKESWTS
jgi:hypothetical protein